MQGAVRPHLSLSRHTSESSIHARILQICGLQKTFKRRPYQLICCTLVMSTVVARLLIKECHRMPPRCNLPWPDQSFTTSASRNLPLAQGEDVAFRARSSWIKNCQFTLDPGAECLSSPDLFCLHDSWFAIKLAASLWTGTAQSAYGELKYCPIAMVVIVANGSPEANCPLVIVDFEKPAVYLQTESGTTADDDNHTIFFGRRRPSEISRLLVRLSHDNR